MYILTLENKEGHSVNTDFIISSFNQREILHQGLKQADDSIRLQIPFSIEIWNFINANKLIKAKITEDGAAYFTGYVRFDFDYSKLQRFQPIQLELVNATYITSFYEIEESIAFKDTTLGAIVSNLLERAEITGQDTSFLDEPIIFDIIEEGTTVKDALSQILFEYGYFWDFDKNGEFTVQKIYNENVTPSVALDGTNILEKVQVSKKEQEFDRVELEYEHLEKFENILIFQDNTGSGTNKGCFIELGPGKYLGQIEGETSYDITYDSDKGEVIWVDNASLSILSNNKDKVQSTFINKNTKGNLSIYNADQYKSSYILLLEVWGTAYVKTIESATIKVGQDGKNKSIKSKYIHSKAAAENFAKMYYDWGKSCDYVISLQSKLNLDVGTIVEVNAAGKIVGRVIEKTTKLDGKPYTYKIEAIKEYELPKITSSILRKSSPIGTAARGTGILKIDTAPTAYTTPVSGITPSYRISKDTVKSQSLANEVYTGDILQYSYYQYQVILVADDYVYTAERTSIRGSVGATGATGPKGPKGDKGENGTSVKILGTKPSTSDLPAKGEIGDSWLVNGNLYVWAGDSWENVGNIQGPKGDTGATGKDATQYYIHYVYCDDTDLGTNYSTADTRKYVGVYVDTTSADATIFEKVPSDVVWSQIEGATGARGSLEFSGTEIYSFSEQTERAYEITTASTGITYSTMPILVGDTYINTTTQDVWICSTAGTPTTAKWKYQGRRCSDKDDSNRFRLFSPATDNGSTPGTITKTVVKGENPFGKIDDLLKITNTNGPASSRYVPYNVNTKIDNKKTYRHVTYIKQEDANYTDFIGIAGYEPENNFCLSLSGKKINSAYFIYSSNFGTLGRWYMVVGYIVANGTTTAPADAGVYDMVTKQKVKTVINYQWKPNVTYCTNSGCLIRYTSNDSTKTGTAYLYDVRLDEVNGTEPSLNELLNLDTTTKSKGTWKASTVYNIGDIVYLNGNSYICTANHTSDTSFDSGRWNIIASKGDTGASVNTNLQNGNKDASDCYGYSAFANGIFEISNSTQTENYIFMADTTDLVSAGKQYTISFEAKQNGNLTSEDVYYYGNDYQNTGYITTSRFSPTTTWQKFSHTFTITAGATLSDQRIRFDNNGTKTDGEVAVLYIRNVKLEEGGIATPFCYSVKDSIGATGQRGGRDLAITTAPAAYTTAIGGFTPSYRIALSTVKTQSGISTVYVGDTLVYGVYRYPVGYVDASYVYTAARTSIKGDKGDTGATGKTGATGASSRTIAYRINYSNFSTANDGEMYVCGYNSAGAQADIPGYVIVNGAIHFIKGMLNPNVPINGYVVAEIGGTSDSPKTPFFAFYDWGTEKYYKIENGQEPAGKTWEQLFTEITNTSDYIVLGKVSSSYEEGPLTFEETTPCLLSSVTEEEENFTYQGVVANTTDMHTEITPYKFSQDAYGNWIKTALPTKTVKKWSFVLCMNAETPNSSTAAPVMKVFNGTWWYEIRTISAYYSSLQSMMAGDLPAVAGYYDTLGLAVPSICGTYIKTLTSNKAFINELFANDITVGYKIRSSNNNFIIDWNGNATLKSGTIGGISIDSRGIETPFTPTTGLRCYVEYNKDDTGTTNWTTDLSKVYNSSTANGTTQYVMRFGYKAPGLSTQIPVYNMFKSIVGTSGAQYAFSTVDSPYTVPSLWTNITRNSFPRTETINTKYKYLFIKLGYLGPNSPEIYALPCYTTSTRSDGFEINSDGSAIFTGKARFEGGIGIVCDAKDVSRNKGNGLLTITYHFPIDFSVYDVLIFLEPNGSNNGTKLLYKFTCSKYEKLGRPAIDIFTTYNDTPIYSNAIEASIENDNVGYNSQQYPNGYIDKNQSMLKKVVIRQTNTSLPIAAIKAVLIPYVGD